MLSTADARALIADARAQAGALTPQRRRGRRTIVLSGALALLMMGGAGVATAWRIACAATGERG